MRCSCTALLLTLAAPFVFVAIMLLLVFRGSPGQCGGGRNLDTDPALAFEYDQRYAQFNQTLLNGLPATMTVSEREANSRARFFLATSDAPVDDFRLCFVDGRGDVNAKLDTPFGGDVAVRVKGSANLDGRHPEADIDSIKIGAVPSFVTRPFQGLVSRIVDHQLDQIELDNRLTAEVGDGEVVISGEP
jgi:hypothetical protein